MRPKLAILALLSSFLAYHLFAQGNKEQPGASESVPQRKAQAEPKSHAARQLEREEKTIPQILQERLDAAQKSQKQGDTICAESEYRQALGIALEELGSLYQKLDRLDESVGAYKAATEARTNSEKALIGLGFVYLLRGEHEKGIEAVKLLIAQRRANPAARSLLGRIYLGMKKYDLAVQELEEARKWESADQEIKLVLASAYLQQKRPEKAEEIFAEMLKSVGDSPSLRILFGIICLENEYYNRALEELKHATALDANYPRVHYYLGLAYVSQEGQRDTGPAIKEFQEELARHPNDYLANYMIGIVYLQERRYQEAAAALKEAVELEPSKPDPRLYLGQSLFLSGQQDKAIPHLLKAIELTADPSRNRYQISRAHYLLSQYNNRQGNIEEARKQSDLAETYRKKVNLIDQERMQSHMGGMGGPNDLMLVAVSATPSVLNSQRNLQAREKEELLKTEKLLTEVAANAYNQLGLLCARRSDSPCVAQMLDRAAQLKTDIPDTHIALGRVLESDANLRGAETEFTKALALDPKLPDAHYQKGLALIRESRNAEAAEEFRQELALNAAHSKAAFHLGYCLAALDRQDEAIESFKLAVRLNPSYAEAYYELGKARLKADHVQESIDALEKAVQLGGNRSCVQYQLSMAYRRAGKLEAALAALESYRDLKAKEQAARPAPRTGIDPAPPK